MSELISVPYLLELNEGVNEIHFVDVNGHIEGTDKSLNIAFLPPDGDVEEIFIPHLTQINEGTVEENTNMDIDVKSNENEALNYVYELVYPEELNIKPIINTNRKRGRPKKKKNEQSSMDSSKVERAVTKSVPRTRSGRLVKFPKHYEKDFEKVEIGNATELNDSELKTSKFVRFDVENTGPITNKELYQLEFHQRRRKISSQYRCPKCQKAYLGKNRMLQHIKKYPDHGPIPLGELNFDVWNYLVDITQKCLPAQRGIKFCEELTNLLHNVLLLTSALFKKVEQDKNYVEVDKILGNAIGILPGLYKFNENELYKDVTILKLITNTDFFKPMDRQEDQPAIVTDVDHNTVKVANTNSNEAQAATVPNMRHHGSELINSCIENHEDIKENEQLPKNKNIEAEVCFDIHKNDSNTEYSITKSQTKITKHIGRDLLKTSDISNFTSNDFSKHDEPSLLDPPIPAHTELLTDHSLLHIPSLRSSVDELMLATVDSSGIMLDNSTSSDEVMNVDQFVNERFKKITEPYIEIGQSALNLDLPSMDLFQFNTS